MTALEGEEAVIIIDRIERNGEEYFGKSNTGRRIGVSQIS